jgi:GTP-binding protein HflX
LLSDTVGFIRKLPHQLVEAFKATLEEVVEADLLLHVVDLSHPLAAEQIHAVNQVLGEIGAADKPTLMVFNKTDLLAAPDLVRQHLELHPNAVAVSARTREGFDELMGELGTLLRPTRDLVDLKIPHEESALIARLHEVGQVVRRDYNGAHVHLTARIPPYVRNEFDRFIARD